MTVIGHRIEGRTRIGWHLFAVFLTLHGIAHLVGTSTSFRFAAEGKTADYLGGLWKISDPAALKVVGVVWVLPAAAFLVAAWAFWNRAPWRLTALVAATLPALVLSAVALWAAIVGVVIDVLLLGVAVYLRTQRAGTAAGHSGRERADRR